MKFPWRYLVVVGGVMLAGALIVACEEEVVEPFPDMAPPAAGEGGVRGHMHGQPTEAVLCSEEWDTGGLELEVPAEAPEGVTGQLVIVNCPGSEWTANIDASENDLFFFDGLEAGDYWLMARADSGQGIPGWFRMGEHGYEVTVKEGQWTDLPTFESE